MEYLLAYDINVSVCQLSKKAPTPGLSQSVHSVSYSEISSNTFEALSTYPARTTSNSRIHKSTIVPLILIFVPGVRHQHAHFQHLILALPRSEYPPPPLLCWRLCVCLPVCPCCIGDALSSSSAQLCQPQVPTTTCVTVACNDWLHNLSLASVMCQ